MCSPEVSDPVSLSEVRNSDGSLPEGPTARRSYYGKAAIGITGIGFLTLASAISYRVRELLSALILFTFLFGIVILAILILWLFGETTHNAVTALQTHVPRIPSDNIATTPTHSNLIRPGDRSN
jgi:hypothetical protein